jgi:chromosome segregation ATPase
MKLMCSQNPDDVKVVKNELLKAGIPSETRVQPIAGPAGFGRVELWVENERDFVTASKLYGRIQDRASGRPAGNGADSKVPGASRREDLKHARLLLERGIEEMFQRESELAGECASLRSKAEESSQGLAKVQAALAREIEGRAVAEKNQAEQIAGLTRALEAERQNWQQQIKARDELVKKTQLKLDATARLLQNQQASLAALKEQGVALELAREEHEKSLCQARTEALAEREARIAAEAKVARAQQTQKSLETELFHRKELDQQMQAYVASLSSLCGKMETKA